MTAPTTQATERRTAATFRPIWREVDADLETPVSAYLKLARGRYGYLLESVEGGERIARYSFVGADPYAVLRVRNSVGEWRWFRGSRAGQTERVACPDALSAVRAELERRPIVHLPGQTPRFHGGAVGYLAYEAAARFEPTVPVPVDDPLDVPEAVFMFSDTLLIFDHVRHTALLLTWVDGEAHADDDERAEVDAQARLDEIERRLRRATPRSAPPLRRSGAGRRPVAPSRLESRPAYEAAVRDIQEYMRAGDCFQVVPSRRVARPLEAPPFEVYRALRSVNPSPYMFYLALDDFAVAGASPELLVRVEDGAVAVHPIAGTRRRDADPDEDARLEAELRSDEKERAEHVMLVDLGRNDVGRVSAPGSVAVTQFLDIERYSHVMHLVSHVTGRLRADMTPYDALRAGFPAGTVSGAPKIRAMQIIAEVEGQRRGVYAGAVGYIGFDGALDTCIAIRTLVMKDGVAYGQAGGGIVADSQPADEFQETENKLGAVLRALDIAQRRAEAVSARRTGGAR